MPAEKHIDTTFHFCVLWSHRLKLNYGVFMSLKIVFIFTNSAVPEQMQPLSGILSGSLLFAKVPVYM